ncbi:hypothetical protein D3C80_992600 [compost metagenome]
MAGRLAGAPTHRRPGRAPASGSRGTVRRPGAGLRQPGASGQPTGPSPGRRRRRRRDPCRRGLAPWAAGDRRLARGAQGRWRLCAAGRQLSGRAPGLPDAGLRYRPVAHRLDLARATAAAGGVGCPQSRPARPDRTADPCAANSGAAAEPGLCDLHLRFHRQAQGGVRRAWPAGDALRSHRPALCHGRGRLRAALHVVRLRRRS